MRDIEFRGKRKDNRQWVSGYFVKDDAETPFIHAEALAGKSLFAIIPETVGQYVGRKDYSGAKIFEGDIVDFTVYDFDDPRHYRGIVTFSKKYCDFELWKSLTDFEHDGHGPYPVGWSLEQDKGLKVIGNIHDTPELLGRE